LNRSGIAWLRRRPQGGRPASLPANAPRDPTGHGAPVPSIEKIAERITGSLRAGLAAAGVDLSGVRLEAEPGRALYADAGIHLATVRNIKHQSRPMPWTWVETDTTEMFMADLLIEHARFGVVAAGRAGCAGRDRG